MRNTTLTLAALLAVAGLAQACLTPPDPACSGTCTVDAASTGYTPPMLILRSGSDVVWHSTDIGHVQRDTAQPVGSPAACFQVSSSGGGNSTPVTFDFDGTTLTATTNSVSTTCPNAVVTEAGALLAYHCTLHANMRGTLLVVE